MRLSLVSLITGSLLLTQPLAAQTPVEEMVNAWNARQDSLDSVRFEGRGSIQIGQGFTQGFEEQPDGSFVKTGFPPFDHNYDTQFDFTLDFENRLTKSHFIGEDLGLGPPKENPQYIVYSSDETVIHVNGMYRVYAPRALNRPIDGEQLYPQYELSIRERFFEPFFEHEHHPILIAMGVMMTGGNYDPANLLQKLNARHFRITGETTHGGRECYLVSTVAGRSNYHDYVVDKQNPLKVYKISRTLTDSEEPFSSSTIKYQETDFGPLPESWTTYRYGDEGKVSTRKMQLTDYEINPELTAADFELDIAPGTRVYDETRDRNSNDYVLTGDEERPEISIREAMMQEAVSAESRRKWMWILAVAGILVAGIIYFKRR